MNDMIFKITLNWLSGLEAEITVTNTRTLKKNKSVLEVINFYLQNIRGKIICVNSVVISSCNNYLTINISSPNVIIVSL